MTAAWVAVGVVLVGLPLLAWWVGGRPGWSRLTRTAPRNRHAEFIRRHRLRTAEIVQVQEAVRQGHELSDPRLRAAVVEQAQHLVAPAPSRARRWLVGLFVVWLALVSAHLVFLLVQGRWGDVNWFSLVWWLIAGSWALKTRAAARRAVRLNSGPPGAAAEPAGQRE